MEEMTQLIKAIRKESGMPALVLNPPSQKQKNPERKANPDKRGSFSLFWCLVAFAGGFIVAKKFTPPPEPVVIVQPAKPAAPAPAVPQMSALPDLEDSDEFTL